jgi:hypothetical protein
MNRHERRAAKARNRAASFASIGETSDIAEEMLEDGLGELRIDILHPPRGDAAKHLSLPSGTRCSSCEQPLDADNIEKLAMIQPGGEWVMRFDERGIAEKPVIMLPLCEQCGRKPELKTLLMKKFAQDLGWGFDETHDA